MKKIEVDVERIRELYKQFMETKDPMPVAPHWYAVKLQIAFPEAFEPEKHPAVNALDTLIGTADNCKLCITAKEMIVLIRSYFNPDGSLKETK